MCFDQLVCEEECCHDLDFGVPYCCSKYTGFIYLGLMVGGGVIIAVLIIACYVFMRRTERELEAAAKLEAAKVANSLVHGTVSDSPTPETDERHQLPDLNLPPPSYQDVVRNFSRCHSCDVSMARPVDIVSSLVRQYSQGNQAPLRGLPVLVDVQELIARHRREHAMEEQLLGSSLPPLMSQEALDNKLPSYEDCTNRDARTSREQGADSQTGPGSHKHTNDVLCRIGCCHDHGINTETQGRRHKLVGETNTYFDDVLESVTFPLRGTGAASEVRDLSDAPQLRSEVRDLSNTPQLQSEVRDLSDAPQLRSGVRDLSDAPQLRSEVRDLSDAPQLQAGACSPTSEDIYSTHKPRETARAGIRARDETATTLCDQITMTGGQSKTVVDLSTETANKTATTVVDLSIEAANKTATYDNDYSVQTVHRTATSTGDMSVRSIGTTTKVVTDLIESDRNQTGDQAGDQAGNQARDQAGD